MITIPRDAFTTMARWAMVGTARKKLNSAAVLRSSPISRPPMMVAPERETPGIMAMHCTAPTPSAVFQGMSSTVPGTRGFISRSISRIRMPPTIRATATTIGFSSSARIAE